MLDPKRFGTESRFTKPNGLEAKVLFHVVEATTDQAAGPDAGRLTPVVELRYTSPGPGTELTAVGDNTYFEVQASTTASTGPWTNILSTPIPNVVVAGVEGTLWLRLLVKRWETTANPLVPVYLLVRRRNAGALWGDPVAA